MRKLLGVIFMLITTIALVGCSNNTDPAHSIYLSAVENGFNGSFEEWLDSLHGSNGSNGSNGKSAYDIYKENYPGYIGTEKDWIDDLIHGRLVNDGYILNSEEIDIDFRGDEIRDTLIKTYFFKEGNVPYLGFKALLTKMKPLMPHELEIKENWENHEVVYSYNYNSNNYSICVNYIDDIITISSASFLTYLFQEECEEDDSYIKLSDIKRSNDNKIVYKLKDYDLDIIRYDDDLLLQADVLTTILFNYRLWSMPFNGDSFMLVKGYPGVNISNVFRNSSKNGNLMPKDLKEATNKGLFFIMDHFYGLKEYKDIDMIADELEMVGNVSHDIKNCNPKYYDQAYLDLFMKRIDDLHTVLHSKSVYHDVDDTLYANINEQRGFESTYLLEHYNEYKKMYEDKFSPIDEDKKPIRYEGSTAFIKFNEFKMGLDLYIYDNNGIKSDAWKHDSFFLVKQSLDEIREYNKLNGNVIKNVCIDLSTNTGGVVTSMQKVVGLLTNKDVIEPVEDSQSGLRTLKSYKVDSDLDEDYGDDDAYTDFKYTFLVSDVTFSAGNYMASLVKDLELGKLIGITTGGGMCTVRQIALLDGTLLRISGCNMIKNYANGEYLETEDGIKPDIEIKSNKLYDLSYINKLIEEEIVA